MEPSPTAAEVYRSAPEAPTVLAPREVPLGGPRAMLVRRTLPHRERRTVGPWCFVDHYGPHDVSGGPGMQVPPHPHMGLQTVSWLVTGEVDHLDSTGGAATIRPGELNLMTSGRGVAHSERSPAAVRPPTLHGVQLWVALPEEARHGDPHFEHHDDLPVLDVDGSRVSVVMGDLAGATSPARSYSPLVAAEVAPPRHGVATIPLDPRFEHAVLALAGRPAVDGLRPAEGALVYLGAGRSEVGLGRADEDDVRVMLLGGRPLGEPLLMWWNFVGRTHEDIEDARRDWQEGRRFGMVVGDPEGPLAAPALPTTRLLPRAATP